MCPLCFILLLLTLIILPTLIYVFYITKHQSHPHDPPRWPPMPMLATGTTTTITVEKISQKMNLIIFSRIDTDVVEVKREQSGGGQGGGRGGGGECPVCLSGFVKGEEVRQLSLCKHMFHGGCMEKWLCNHSSCPVCRAFVATKLRDSTQFALASWEYELCRGLRPGSEELLV